ncbi:MAG: tyrosine-type recombinase/integrase [Cyclonatronaceae bacterium]
MTKLTFTASMIAAAKPPSGSTRIEYRDSVVEGLTLRVTSKSKMYVLRYGRGGKRFNLGKHTDMTLSEARQAARDYKISIERGGDPAHEKHLAKHAPAELTFAALCDKFKTRHLPGLSAKTRYDYTWVIDRELVPILGQWLAKDITRKQVVDLLDAVAIDRGLPTLSNRVRGVLSSIYSFGIDKGEVDDNPVRTVKKDKGGNVKRSRWLNEGFIGMKDHKVGTCYELRAFWDAANKQADPVRTLFLFLLVTGQRSTETRLARWEHIDMKAKTWHIPEANTKAKREHVVPLSNLAVELLTELHLLTGRSPWVFQSPTVPDQPIGWIHKALERIRTDAGIPDIRIHDLRRTAGSFMASLGTDRTVLGKVLNHRGLAGDHQVTSIYDRHPYQDEKQRALQLWGEFLRQEIYGDPGETPIYKMG